MTRRFVLAAALAASVLSAPVAAQRPLGTSASSGPIAPLVITGSPSSGRHCVSGSASNVHSLGWAAAGTRFTVTFNADVSLASAAVLLDFKNDEAVADFGDPDLSFTTEISGTLALLVTSNGPSGCYVYKVEVQPGVRTSSVRERAPTLRLLPRLLPKGTKSPIRTMAITGQASSAAHCVAGDSVARVHALGYLSEGTQVTITFDSDFDPIAGVIDADVAGQDGTYYLDDDSGGNSDPELSFTTSHAGTLSLLVAAYDGAAGCYTYKVAIAGGSTAPLTLAEVAPALANTIASEIVSALESTATAASLSDRLSPQVTFGPRCRGGGSVRITNVGVSGNRYTLSGARATFTNCSFSPGRRTAAINGSLGMGGVWCPGQGSCSGPGISQPATPATVSGSVDVTGVGPVALAAGSAIGLTGYSVAITGAGIQQGVPDKPPTPNPNSCPATVAPAALNPSAAGGTFTVTVTVGATCPWTAGSNVGFIAVTSGPRGPGNGAVSFSVAANTGAARPGSLSIAGHTVSVNQSAATTSTNLTGRWTATVSGSRQSDHSESVSLTQTSTTTVKGGGSGIPGMISNSIDGTISGSRVTLRETVRLRILQQGVSVLCDDTRVHTLTINNTRSMSGTWVLSGRCSIPIPGLPAFNQPHSDSGRVTFTR